MTRAKVITVTFLAGLIVGCAIPAKKADAFTVAMNHTEQSATVKAINSSACTLVLDSGKFSIDCDDVDLFNTGDSVTVTTRNGYTAIITVDGDEVEVN